MFGGLEVHKRMEARWVRCGIDGCQETGFGLSTTSAYRYQGSQPTQIQGRPRHGLSSGRESGLTNSHLLPYVQSRSPPPLPFVELDLQLFNVSSSDCEFTQKIVDSTRLNYYRP